MKIKQKETRTTEMLIGIRYITRPFTFLTLWVCVCVCEIRLRNKQLNNYLHFVIETGPWHKNRDFRGKMERKAIGTHSTAQHSQLCL